jgi:hypothetical protein
MLLEKAQPQDTVMDAWVATIIHLNVIKLRNSQVAKVLKRPKKWLFEPILGQFDQRNWQVGDVQSLNLMTLLYTWLSFGEVRMRDGVLPSLLAT